MNKKMNKKMNNEEKTKQVLNILDILNESLDKETEQLEKEVRADIEEEMNSKDYCYICIAIAKNREKRVIGFTKKYEGIKEIREMYKRACIADNVEAGMVYTAMRWSRNQVIAFFENLKKTGEKKAFMFIGFVPEPFYVETPADIDDLLTLKDLYEDNN